MWKLVLLFLLFNTTLCGQQPKNNANYITSVFRSMAGTYFAKTHCEECSGIETTLVLKCQSDTFFTGTYVLTEKLLETANGDVVTTTKGSWGILFKGMLPANISYLIELLDKEDPDVAVYYGLKKDHNLTKLMLMSGEFRETIPPFTLVLKKE
jgi:hypothetical protein